MVGTQQYFEHIYILPIAMTDIGNNGPLWGGGGGAETIIGPPFPNVHRKRRVKWRSFSE